ncbi:MAG: hypothetical protein BHV94_08590 [Clostridiales bacterium 59_14]|nr:MAG: hypothetical protein BHV94_08590 [Clostridiales bacterium 59_14]
MAGGADNLIPFSERSKEEARECGRAGGIASGIARRRKRSLKEAADLYLSLPVSDKRKWNRIAARYVEPEDIDNQMAMIVGMVDAAAAGDARAARVIVDLIGDDTDADSRAVQVIMDEPLEEYSE